MFRNQLIPIAMATVMALGSSVAIAYAGSNDNSQDSQEMTVLRNAKISLAQAITGAEQQSGGKAINAGLNNENGAMTYGVEVIKGNTIQTVLIDINTGQVVKVLSADTEPEGNNEQNGQETGD